MSVSDDEYVLDLNKMKMADLKRELQIRDLKVSGNKQDLIQRLQQYLEEHEGAEVEDGDDDALGLIEADNEEKTTTEKPDDKSDKNDLDVDESLTKELDDTVEESSEDKTAETEAAVEETKNETATETTDNNATGDDKAEVKTDKPKIVEMTEEQKKEERAKKYGIKVTELSEDSKLELRKKRFGGQFGKSSITDHKVEVDTEKLKKRAERFGTVVSPVLTNSEQEEKIRKRKERFGGVSSSETDAKKQKRAERFGLKVA